ncbi:hypothetical protein OIE91_11305 [Streptomyces albidoflavus]|uniref:hypothetical protein n=1 Tax=Streptomyces albidoflavus TaxID=1886 RepID=UPI00352E0DFF
MTLRVLASFHYFPRTDMADLLADLRSAYDGPVELFADSGAYSAATLGTPIRLADYAAWLREWGPLITTAATLDVIGDPKATAANTAALHDAGHPVLPTFHVGTPWSVLEDLCARHPYIALGGMVPHSASPKPVMRWLVRAFAIARHHGTRFHGFGQTAHTANVNLPFYSVDSSSWTASTRYGRLPLWDDRAHKIRGVPLNQPADVHSHARLLQAHGLDPTAVARTGFGQRAARERDAYEAEQRMLLGAAAEAWRHYGSMLQARHQVQPPRGWQAPGTVLYLADVKTRNFLHAAHYLRMRKEVPA